MNNNNPVYCVIAFAFLFGSIYTMLTAKSTHPFNDFNNSLSTEQKIIYQNIVQERIKIYLTGLVLGIIFVFIIKYILNKYYNNDVGLCFIIAFVLTVQYFYYTLMPKSDYMILHLDKDQNDEWLKVYDSMKIKYHIGLLLGIIAVIFFYIV